MTGFHVTSEALRTHANHLDSASSDVDLAKDAVGTVHIGIEAFGLMCASLIPLVSLFENAAAGGISALGSLVSRTATGMRQMADDYDGSDSAAEQRFKAFDADLGA